MLWTCIGCGKEERRRGEPWPCECGTEKSWIAAGGALEPGERGRAERADQVDDRPLRRIPTLIKELDRLLGGGVVEQSAALVHGSRGSGKSRVCYRAAAGGECLVVHPELTKRQAREIAQTTGIELERVWFLGELNGWESEADRLGVKRVVLDSLGDSADPVGDMKRARAWAQRRGGFVLCIQHTTKDGSAAGPSKVGHEADYELKLSPQGARRVRVRVLKARGSPKGSVVLPLVKER